MGLTGTTRTGQERSGLVAQAIVSANLLQSGEQDCLPHIRGQRIQVV